MGRELGPEGLHAFQIFKTIYLPPPSPDAAQPQATPL
jgi:hypothetical protein